MSSAAAPTVPTTLVAGTVTPSKRTSAKRRTRSIAPIGVTVTPGGVGGDEELREPVAGAGGHQQVGGLGAGLDRGDHAVEHEPVALRRRVDGRRTAPRRHGLTGEQARQHGGPLLRRSHLEPARRPRR